jgi:hypothetical protein
MENLRITNNNLIQFLTSKSILGLTISDPKEKIESTFRNKKTKRMTNKYFTLISYKNVEFTIRNDKIIAIHIENGFVEGRKNLINFDITQFNDIENEISRKMDIISKINNKELLLPDCKLFFNNSFLHEVYFK